MADRPSDKRTLILIRRPALEVAPAEPPVVAFPAPGWLELGNCPEYVEGKLQDCTLRNLRPALEGVVRP